MRTKTSKPAGKTVKTPKTKAKAVGSSAPVVIAAPTTNCNLARDPLTGFLNGKTGDQTSVAIDDNFGAATFVSISYGSKPLGTTIKAVTFTIESGTKELTYVYNSPAGASVQVGDPCGASFDLFTSSGGTVRKLTVVGA
jgi:hypothetical protein